MLKPHNRAPRSAERHHLGIRHPADSTGRM